MLYDLRTKGNLKAYKYIGSQYFFSFLIRPETKWSIMLHYLWFIKTARLKFKISVFLKIISFDSKDGY